MPYIVDMAEGAVMCLILWIWLYSKVPYIVDMAEGTVMCLILWMWLKVQ